MVAEGGLARRIAVSADPAMARSGEQWWTIVELWDFGVAVDAAPPPADEVVPPDEAFRDAPGPGA